MVRTREEAIKVAKEWHLEAEVAYCIDELKMSPIEALYEWDLAVLYEDER